MTRSLLSLLLWNIRSIKSLNKFVKFKSHITELVSDKNKILDCLVLTESWINALDEFKLYELRNYNSFTLSRDSTQGGGIIIYVRKFLVANVVTRICNQHVEAILVEILSSNIRQKVLGVYRPPSGNLSVFYEIMEDFLNDYDDILVAGDMNINFLNQNVCKQYSDLLLMNDYFVANNSVTRSASGTLLDHILLKHRNNKSALICTAKNCKLSDHNFVVVMKKITHQSNWIQTNFSKINFAVIREELATVDFNNVISKCPNVDVAFSQFILLIQSLTTNARTTYNIRHKFVDEVPPYIDQKYIRLTNHINNLHDKIHRRKMINLPVSCLESKMSGLEVLLNQHVNMKAKSYYTNMISNNKPFSWNVINRIAGRSKKDENIVIKQDGNLIYDKKDVATLFQVKFNAIVCNTSFQPRMIYLGESLINSIRMDAVSKTLITDLMKDLSLKKATGSDGLPVKIWKDNIDIFAPVLTNLVNDMLVSGTYPDILKIAAVKPIHKNGSKTSIENYRGISLLPAINKVVERVIYDKIESFTTKFKQFDELQFGYRKFYGTQDALCKLFSVISKALDKGKFVVAVFFDISKAFDSIHHKLLLFKLEKMGFRGKALELIKSYLSNRQQFVKIADELSEITDVLFGVPQGSCLGPLLFVMLLYDLKFVETASTIIKYADDIVMLLTCDSVDDIPGAISKDIDEIKRYYENNGLKLNTDKSKYMTFGFTSHEDLDNGMISKGIGKVATIKYLGAVLDDKLKLNQHADHIIRKISQSVNAMNIIKKHLPTYSLLQFYHAFIGSHLFSSGFLLYRMNAEDLKRLQVIQNKSLKIAFGLDKRFSTEKLFTEVAVSVLPIMGIACFNLLLLTKKYILTNLEDFEIISEGRRKNQLKFLRYRKNILAKDLICLGPKVYNQLPLEIRDISRYSLFKQKLKTFLLEHKQKFLEGSQLNVNNFFDQHNP